MDAKAIQEDLKSLDFTPSLVKPEMGKEVGIADKKINQFYF